MSHVNIWGSASLTAEAARAEALKWEHVWHVQRTEEGGGWREGDWRVVEDEASESMWDRATQGLLGRGRDSGGHSE